MKLRRIIILLLMVMLHAGVVQGQQIALTRIDQMPNLPSPYAMRDWKTVAKGYDSLVFALDAAGEHLPLASLYSNTVNYPAVQSFKVKSYVGSPGSGGEGINCLPAVIGAALVGINKRSQNGIDWVAMTKEWFNTLPAEQVYLNSPRSTSGDDWWYETMPNVFFYQLYDLHPDVPEFAEQYTMVADRWLAAVEAMSGSATPWHVPNMDHRAWKLSTMTPNDAGVHEPEAAGAIGWLLYQAYINTGEKKYRIGAEWSMEFLNGQSLNPAYELQLAYGAVTAARMNAELGTTYDLQKIVTWCFDVGPLRSWGTTLGRWGNYDCYGLAGEVRQFEPSYAFAMNTFQHIAILAPVARYDDRYARALGKWILNAANSARHFYGKFLPDSNQDGREWSIQHDPHSYIAYEALKQTQSGKSPFATGDAVSNGWAATNLALYGSSHVGYLAAVVDTTDVPMVLQIDLLATDFAHAEAYPTFLYFNPYDSIVTVTINAGNVPVDLYDAAANATIQSSVTQSTKFDIPANSARVIVLLPAGGTESYQDERMLVNGIVADYRSSNTVSNHAPRIKSLSAPAATLLFEETTEIFCTPDDREGDSLAIEWHAEHGTLYGTGFQVVWKAPDTAGTFRIISIVKDQQNATAVDTVAITVVHSISHAPVIGRIKALPRKIDLNSPSVVTCEASDLDGDTLSFSWSAPLGTITGSGTSVTWHSPATAGNYWVYCSVDDGYGGIGRDSLQMEVRDFSSLPKGNRIAYYPFSGNANDASGNGRNGTAINVQLTADRQGNPNSAYLFDGATASIRIPNDNGLNVQNAFSINFWMKVGAFYNREQYPVSHGNWMNRWKISLSNGRVRWTVKTSAGTKDLDSETSVVLDSLYNITAVYNGAEMELYLNGELDAFVPFTGTIQTTSLDLTIGQAVPNDNNYNFNGVLDDLQLFDYGLSVAEISSLASLTTVVDQEAPIAVPATYALEAYPNPFNPHTVLRLSLPKGGRVTVKIFDLLGRETALLADQLLPAGTADFRWNAAGKASGVYFCVAATTERTMIKKLVLTR